MNRGHRVQAVVCRGGRSGRGKASGGAATGDPYQGRKTQAGQGGPGPGRTAVHLPLRSRIGGITNITERRGRSNGSNEGTLEHDRRRRLVGTREFEESEGRTADPSAPVGM